MLILRPVDTGDLDALLALATQLDSLNLPADRDFLEGRIRVSKLSFARGLRDWREGIYVFVLEDSDALRCVGTSTIIAKNGRPGAPYFWLAVTSEERRSAELGKRFVHTKLQLQSTEDGPTEIGGLVLEPGLPATQGDVRQGALHRALRLHVAASGPLRARGDRRDALALHRDRRESALGRLRRALHRVSPTARPTTCRRAPSSSSRISSRAIRCTRRSSRSECRR